MDLEKLKNSRNIQDLINLGLLNIDKPSDWTSFDVVNYIRKMFGLNKAGHLGTLDPSVTGVLPICLEKTCRIQEYFMHQDKVYVGKMLIHKEITKAKLEEAIKKFVGKINQLPPRISRVKRVVREREVKIFKITAFNEKKREASFLCEVEAGTYIRKLIDDLGKELGVGAQMIELRRTRAGLFSDKDLEFVTIEELEKSFEEYKKGKEGKLRKLLVPAELILNLIKSIKIKQEFIPNLKNGSPIFKKMLVNIKDLKIVEENKPFAIIDEQNNLIEIAKKQEQGKFENPEIIAKPEAVLI